MILADRLGGGVWRWIAQEPLPVFNTALDYLGPLRAADDLARLSLRSLTSGQMKEFDFALAIDEMQERANRLSGIEPEEHLLTMEEQAAALARMGFDVEIVD